MGLSRYKDWLQEYIYYTSGHELPTLYHKWVGIGLIASVLKQNVWINMRDSFKIYPNLFIVIVDKAGAGKSHAIEHFGLGLLKTADGLEPTSEDKVYVYNQRISAAAMIKSMAELYKNTGEHCITVFAEELGFFTNLSGENSNISHTLIKTYDNDDLSNETIARSFEGVPNAQFNIIGGTTPDSLKESVAKKFIGDGVVSRITFIHSEDIGDPKPFPTPPPDNGRRKTYLAYDLNEFKRLRGEFQWTQEAVDCYENWYVSLANSSTVRDDKLLVKRLAGKMLKIAMILSVARKHNLILEAEDIVDAIRYRNEALNNYLYIDKKLTTNEFGDKIQKLLDKIKYKRKVTHSELMKSEHHWIHGVDFNNAIMTLEEAEMIEIKTEYTEGSKKPAKVYLYRG